MFGFHDTEMIEEYNLGLFGGFFAFVMLFIELIRVTLASKII